MGEPSSGFKRNAQGNRVASVFSEGLDFAQVDKMSSEELISFLQERSLLELSKLASTEKYDGPAFVADMELLRRLQPIEMEALATSLMGIEDTAAVVQKEKFSLGVDIVPESGFFYEEASTLSMASVSLARQL